MGSIVDSGATATSDRAPVRTASPPSFLRRHWPLWIALAVVVVGRIALSGWPFTPDESGFYLVADDLVHHGGDGLYGHYWVDRPPLLIWLFAIAAGIGDIAAVRWLVGLSYLAFVALAYVTSRRLGGSGGWAAAVATAFAITPEVGAQVANGEAFSIPLVLGSILCVAVAARHPGRRALAWSCAAGFVGLLAMAVKQNFVDGLVFALVLLVADGLRGERTWPDVVRRLVAGGVGVLGGVVVMVAYALTTGAGVAGLWLAWVSFRGDATEVIRAGYRTGIEERETALVSAAWTAGVIPLVIVLICVAVLARFRGSAVAWAVAVVIGVEVLCIVVGGNYWSHYLLGMAPGLVLAAGLATQWHPVPSGDQLSGLLGRARWLVMAAAAYVVCSALVAMTLAMDDHDTAASIRAERIGQFVAASAEPGDTATTLFGRADVQFQTGLRSPYEHLWSLPVRVLDPDLEELTALLDSDDAPTWLVQVFSFHAWGLEPGHRIDSVITDRYEVVQDDCGTRIYKLRSVHRSVAPAPAC